MPEGIQLLVGLGNPGARYEQTRHNVGFWLVDALAQQSEAVFKASRQHHGELAQIHVAGQRCWLLKPTTYVNRSGDAVMSLLNYYKIPLRQMAVVHDDLDLPPGQVKLKFGGGHGGHNGLRHICAVSGDSDFYRIRLGIGHPGHRDEVTNYVLSRPSREDQQQIMTAIDEVLACMPEIMTGDMDKAMQKLHTK